MKVLILAGGYGMRLQAVAPNTAKALLKVAGKPIIDHILEDIKPVPDIKEVIVVTNDKFYKDFESWAKDHKQKYVFKLRIVNDGTRTNEDRLGSIGDINYVLKNVKVNDDLLVIGGDNLFDFNIDAYIRFSRKKTDSVTIGLFDIKDKAQANKYGVVQLNKDKLIVSFEEKPPKPKSSLVAMCLYYLPKKTLGLIGEYLIQSGKSDRAGDYIIWLKQNYKVYGFEFSGKWFDIGSVESYNDAQHEFTHK